MINPGCKDFLPWLPHGRNFSRRIEGDLIIDSTVFLTYYRHVNEFYGGDL
jgi:hypothetical protein